MKRLVIRIGLTLGFVVVFATHVHAVSGQQPEAISSSQTEITIPSAALLEPADLVRLMQASHKPILLQVGSHVLYAEAHITGSEYVGAAGTPAGLQALRNRVSELKKDQLIVLYCGCCPWGRCPNIRPAYQQLQSIGFRQVRVLYLADNFGTDWAGKGYPVAKGR